MSDKQCIKLLIYIIDNNHYATQFITKTVEKLQFMFKEAINIEISILNFFDNNLEFSEFVCNHKIPINKCCYEKPLLKFNKLPFHKILPINPALNLPDILNNIYESVKFSNYQVGANCFFIYNKKFKGVWQVISQLLPFPDEIIGDTRIIRSNKTNSFFIRHIDTSIHKPLFELWYKN